MKHTPEPNGARGSFSSLLLVLGNGVFLLTASYCYQLLWIMAMASSGARGSFSVSGSRREEPGGERSDAGDPHGNECERISPHGLRG
jgi:hypothetical protein